MRLSNLMVSVLTSIIPAALPGGAQHGETTHVDRLSCGGQPVSRWSAGTAVYQRTASFGQGGSQWLVGFAGMDADSARVVIYDAAEANVLVLDPKLRLVDRFGRKGDGPGEFATSFSVHIRDPFRRFTINAVELGDSLVYVYDGRAIQSYTLSGEYVDRFAVRRGPATFSLLRMAEVSKGLLFSYDSLDLRGPRGRRLQTYRLLKGRQELLHTQALPAPPLVGASFSTYSRDPRPLWVVAGSCVVWADGVSPRLFRYNLVTGAVDTVRLPRHSVPPDDSDGSVARRFAERMNHPRPPDRPSDAPLWHWSGLVADPDGHLWVRPWTTGLRHTGPAYRVDPGGRVHTEVLPEFPLAFGPPGVFYAWDRVIETDEDIIVRFEQRQR